MKNCVNFNSPDVVKLAGELNVSPVVAAAKIGVWQSKNNIEDRFPTVDELQQSNKINYQKNQTNSNEGIIASEKTIRDLAAKIADRIGMKVAFESDRSKDYKGKIENGVAYVNLAYATLDTPIHEILGHPIIRAIKNNITSTFEVGNYEGGESLGTFKSKEEAQKFINSHPNKDSLGVSFPNNIESQLYQNLLKELETGKGKEVLDRIKRDYVYKLAIDFNTTEIKDGEPTSTKEYSKVLEYAKKEGFFNEDPFSIGDFTKERTFSIEGETYKTTVYKDGSSSISKLPTYSLEEQQEEAIVELLGLMTAEKLDKVKDGKLISLLKRLLKEMKQFVRSLINQKEVEVDKLPDNMTLGDLSDLLAYSNSKLILPGYEVEYTTPDNEKFKTYQEASNHISDLAKNVKDVDLSDITVSKDIPDNFTYIDGNGDKHTFNKINENEYEHIYSTPVKNYNRQILDKERYVNTIKGIGIYSFIDTNKEYEQSKEIIEEWKKVNNIQYNPEEIYSRGQEFSSVVGAYSSFDVNLMMQNLLSHIEDNEKAGGQFAISAYTKPIDKQIGHLEGGGGKIKFKLYPQSNDILWAANTDVYSGSVWDASEKVNKDKKSELLGVSYTKYPSLSNVNTVQPNLASIVDDLNHHHNELGIVLTGNNFRLEYDEDIPYTTKKIIDSINSILDQKYGKLVKPEIKTPKKLTLQEKNELQNLKDLQTEAFKIALPDFLSVEDLFSKKDQDRINELQKTEGIQPTQTNDTLKESIDSVRSKFNTEIKDSEISSEESFTQNGWTYTFADWMDKGEQFSRYKFVDGQIKTEYISKENFDQTKKEYLSKSKKEYTSQALINTKIAALKEVAKKQPRSLIRSEVKPINSYNNINYAPTPDLFDVDEFPFQKIPSVDFNKINNLLDTNITKEVFSISELNSTNINKNVDNSQVNKQLLFNTNNQNSLLTAEVLTNIIEQIPDNLTDEFKVLIDKARKVLDNTKAKVEVSTIEEMSKKYKDVDSTVAMLYDANTNKIVISEEALTKLTSQEVVQSFIHEVVHAIVVKAIKNPQTFEEKEALKFFEKAFEQYKRLAAEKSSKKESYGFTNIDEFIAEIYSNPEFQNELKEIQGFWNELKDVIRRLLNMIKSLVNDELIDATLLINKVNDLVEQTNNSDFNGYSAESGIRFDAMFIKFNDFAEQNNIKPEIQKTINEIIDNDNFIKLSEDQKNYVNLNNGVVYERVTSYIQDKEVVDNDLLRTASALGNKVDEFVRDYFDDNLQSFESYNLSSKKEMFQFKKQLDELQKIIQANGEHVIAKNIVLYNDDLKLAGTIDLMTVSKQGDIKIYDVKSMRGNQFETSYYNDENTKYDTKRYGSSKREMHQKQLSLYRILLNNTHGLDVVDLNVIPVELDYNENDVNSNVVNLLDIVSVKALNKVKDAEFISKKTQQKGKKVRTSVLSESEGYNLDTIEKQIQNVLNKAKDILNQNIAHYKAVTKSIKDPVKKQQWTKFVDSFDDTLSNLETLKDGEELTGILNYVNSLQKGVASLKSSFDKKEFTEEETIQVVHNYTKYLDSFTIHKDIQKLLSDIKVNNKFDSDTIDISEIENALDSVVSDYTKLKSEYSAFLKNAIKLKLSTLKYLPELETMWINKLKTEYKSSPKSISQTEWIANAMNTTYKEDIDADIEDYLNKLINNPSFDISIGTHFLSSAINTNSHLIQIFNQILNEVKEEINQTMREKEAELKNLFDKLVKEKGSSNPSVLYKNLVFKNPNGNYSLVNDIKNLSKIEKEALAALKDIQDFVDYSTYRKQSKKVKINGQVYYELPSITKSDLERVLEGDIKGTIKDKWTDLTTIKADDVEFRYKTDNDHNLIYNVPVRYRAKIEAKDQSLDVLTVYRLEYLNGVNFKVKTKAEKDLTTIIDIAKSKEYYREEGGIKNYVKSTFTKNNEIELTPGEKSNTLKMLNSLLETNIYDIGHRYAGKTGKVDNNKLLSFFNGATASIGLSLNRFGATANVINAKAQVFLEGISKGVINNNNIKKAELLYSKEIFNGNLFNDLGQPVEKSFINQMNRMFDTFGFNQNAMNDFVKQGILKSYSNLGTLQFMHKTGEHWVQSVLTAAVLDSVKVMNSDNRFIDKKGNEVSEDKAASLLDMLYIDSKDGILKISDKVVYTTKSLTSKMNEGGKEKINLLIERKIKDCFGNYNPTTQPEASRHIWGKLTLPFRRFYVEMATKRFKAFGTSSKSKDEIEANPRYKHYNYALQAYDEGTYTSLVRFLRHGVIPMLKQMKFHILSQEWEKLSDLERANIKHSVSEITATLVILPLIGMLLGNMLGGNDDDDEMIYFWMYQTRRLTTELAQFRNPSENIKMTRSPIPSMRLIENGIDVIGKTLNFWSWDEEMKSGPNKGDLKIGRAWSKMIPVLNQIDKNSKDLYKYQTAMFGSY